MTAQKIVDLLARHGIKPTANRITIARTLSGAHRPLSQGELEESLLSIDKSVISRTLAIFREHHLVHVVEDGSNALRYELCNSHSKDGDDDLHVHFYCEQCHRSFCMEDVPVPALAVPKGFLALSASHVIKGLCPACRKKVEHQG